MKRWRLLTFLALGAVTLRTGEAAAAVRGDYRFAPGDVLEVTVSPQRGFDRTVTVQPDGKISYPIVGPVQAAGLTLAQVAEELRAGLNRELLDPSVIVSLKELNKGGAARVSLLGAVRNPGPIEIREGMTVVEALAAGGGSTSLADLGRVTVTRTDGSVIPVDLAQAERTGHLERNAVLQPGDLIVVPEGAPSTVLVLGEVMRRGAVEIRKDARLLDAISLAGGPTAEADLRRVTLARAGGGGTQTIDLEPLLAGATPMNLEGNVALHPGDAIVIPQTEQRICVLGRVTRPDFYVIKPGERVLDALAKAGGPAADGDLAKVVLLRRGESGQPAPKVLDLKRMMAKGQMADNELLRAGDMLFVPDRKVRRSPLDFATLLLPVTSLLNVFGR